MKKITYIIVILLAVILAMGCTNLFNLDGGSDDSDNTGDDGSGSTETENLLVFTSDRDGDREIFSLNLDTNVITQLTDNTATDKHPDVSNDGSKIVFVSDRNGSWEIFTMDSDGTNISEALVSLTGPADGNPEWSSDGSKISYINNLDVFTMNADGSTKTNITNRTFDNEFEVTWSPDGSQLAFAADWDGDLDIYIINSDGSDTAVKITDNTEADREPSWAPDGTKIAFSGERNGDYEIFSIGIDGLNETNLTTNSGADETLPNWAANGIAYEKSGDILSLDPESPGTITTYVDDPATDSHPSW